MDRIQQNPEILSRVKICLKMDIFNHSESAKDEIWQNPEYLSGVENLVKKWDFWPLRICKYEIGQNPEYLSCVENLAQKLSFFTTSFLGNLAKSRNFQSHWKFGLKEIEEVARPAPVISKTSGAFYQCLD